jgi:hypothetical protein
MPFPIRSLLIRVTTVLLLAAWALSAQPASAQDLGGGAPLGKPPVMQTVFFNVVWGAGTGALLGAASASLSAGSATDPENLRTEVITGATLGSVVGAAVGIWLVFNGITFDADRSLLFGSGLAANPYRPNTPPLVFTSEPGRPFSISGFKALVLDLSF